MAQGRRKPSAGHAGALLLVLVLALGALNSNGFVPAPPSKAQWPALLTLAGLLASAPAAAEEASPSPSQSPEDMLMQLLNGATGGDGDASESTPSLLLLGFGALLLYGVFAVFKFLLAAAGGLFVVRELDQQFGQEGRKTSKVFEKALRRFAGEPADLLEERRLKVVRLNDEVVSFQASLAEQVSGPSAGAAIREKTRRRRFAEIWQHVLDDVAISDAERQKVEEAVQKYMKNERERQEEFQESRSEWLKSLFDSSFFGGMSTRFQVTSSLDKQIRLQEELVADLKKAIPDGKFLGLKKVLQKADLTWLLDTTTTDMTSAKENSQPSTTSTTSPKSPAASPASAVYVLSFDGDPTAAGVSLLSQEVTAILEATTPAAEVVLKLKSPGGTVTGYGLAAAQLLRFRANNIRLVVCVDELAASGGYMMACCADRILCSPFAAVGSIGVIAGVPNAVERLDREGLKVIQTTAGKWKRTIDPFQAPTPEALQKAEEDVNRIYRQFSRFVKGNRPDIAIEEVATGEVWFGADALEKGLVDELQTSSEYLLKHMRRGHEVLSLSYNQQTKGLGSLVNSLATASELAGALKGAGLDLSDLSKASLSTLSTSQLSPLFSSESWPSSLPEPRVEARGPLGPLGPLGGKDTYGF